jgi:type 1 glutamine amidotransferase
VTAGRDDGSVTVPPQPGPSRVLLFTRTDGYRHDSIEAGIRAVRMLASDDGLDLDHTEDPEAFTESSLSRYGVVVWLSTMGEVLDDAQRTAFAAWLRDGGAFAGIHSATASELEWPEFERIAGAVFVHHPEVQRGVMRVEDATHPSTRELPPVWSHEDEWYDFAANPRDRVQVLLTVDESSYQGGQMGPDHPVAWCLTYGDGRCWYTSLGHKSEAFADELFLRHLRGGLRSLWHGPGADDPA